MPNQVFNGVTFTVNASGVAGISSAPTTTITGSIIYHSTFVLCSGSAWQRVPTGSFSAGTHYLALHNTTTASVVDVACNNTASSNGIAKLAYNDAIPIPVYLTQSYWVKEASNGTASVKVVSVEW